MTVRRAVAADAAAIAHVHLSARAEAYGDASPPRPMPEDITFLVADHDGVVVGFAAIDDEILAALYVLPGAQGGGFGSALLRSAVKEGASTLWVYSSNTGARRFYEHHGWIAEPETEMTGEDWNPREPALRYVRA